MKTLHVALSISTLVGALHLASPALAAPIKAQRAPVKIASVHIPEHELGEVHRTLSDMKVASQRRVAGFTFHKIVKGDFTGEYVLERNGKVTAFLDPSDTMHPAYAKRGEDWAHSGAEKIAPQKRIKFLVTPNRMHEHIGSNLEGEVHENDLELALETMREAKRIATKMGVVNPRIYINNQNTASIGQLHVHVLGERAPGFQYPKPIASVGP